MFGIFVKIWSDTVHLSFLNSEPLSNIEFHHPYIPNAQTIVITVLCCVSLMFVSIDTIGSSVLNDPYEWIYLAAFFLVVTSMGVISELKYQGSKDLAFAFVVGTALAFCFLVVRQTLIVSTIQHALTLLLLLTSVTILAWGKLFTRWSKSTKACLAVTFCFWILLYIQG